MNDISLDATPVIKFRFYTFDGDQVHDAPESL